MNEKILLSEISRIQNLMDLKNHLILEQLNKFADELNSKLDNLLKKLDNNEIDLAQFYGSISDIRTKISTSSLNINERNALNKILDDIDLERKSQVMGKTEANKLVDSLKMKIKNDNILKNAEAKTKVKEIIDLDAIKKSDEYIKIVFDMPTQQVDQFKTLFKTYPNDSEVLKLYNSAEELINDKSDSVAKVFSQEIGFDYNTTKKYFKEWMENNIDFSNAFKKSPAEGGSGAPIQRTIVDANQADDLNPQSYLDEYSIKELEEMHGFLGWKYFGYQLDMMSGWKFHVFGEDLKDAIYLEKVLKPVVNKWGAEAKVGGISHTDGVTFDSMKPGGVQYGKQGATIYIPVDVINTGRQKEMLADIQNALTGYNKGGNISGDQAITPSIHYRYEYLGPVPKEGLPRENARAMYNENDGGPYKPDDVEDLFSQKTNNELNDYINSYVPYREDSTGNKIYLDQIEPEVYLKYKEIIKKDRSEWTDEDLLLFQEVSKYENTMMDVNFSKFKSLNLNTKEIPPSRFEVGGTSLEFLKTPGHKTFGDSSEKYLHDSLGLLNKTDSYYVFFTKNIDDEKVYYFGRKDIFDSAGRLGNFEVAIPYPKNSNVTLDDVKQILVDKSNEIHKNWLFQRELPYGKITSDLSSTPIKTKDIGELNNNIKISEIPVVNL